MPTYVYECKTCDKVFEVEQRITEDALTDCECGAKGSLRRLIQPTAVMFKGSGFYVNDAKPSGGATEAKSEAKTEIPVLAGEGTCGSGGCPSCAVDPE